MSFAKKIPLTITAISVIIGFMMAIQFNTYNKSSGTESKDISQLRQDLQHVMEQQQRILADISKYDQLSFEYESPVNRDNSRQLMEEELKRLKAFGGLEPMKGSGLIATIDEIVDHTNDEFTSFSRIYDDDLRLVVNELFRAGALAIAINDNRMTPQTAIRNVGEDIQIDTKIIRAPFEIKAIGDPEVLESAMKLNRFEELFQVFNNAFTTETRDEMTVPSYKGRWFIRHMNPLKEEA